MGSDGLWIKSSSNLKNPLIILKGLREVRQGAHRLRSSWWTGASEVGLVLDDISLLILS